MPTPKQQSFFESFAGPRATSRFAVLPMLLLLSVGTGISQDFQGPEQLATWLGIAFQSFLVSALLFFLLSPLVAKVKQPMPLRVFAVGAFYFLIEMARALFVGISAFNLGLSEEVEYLFRIVAGGLTGLTLFGASSIILNDTFSYRLETSQLIQIREQIAKSIADSKLGLSEQRLKIVAQINETVEKALQSVLTKSKISPEQANQLARELIRVSDEVVRPLSHSVYDQGISEKSELLTKPIKVRLGRVLELVPTTKPFRFWPLLVLALLLGLPATLFSASNPGFASLSLGIILITAFITLRLFERIIAPRLKSAALFWQLLLVPAAYLIFSAVPSLLFVYLDQADMTQILGLLLYTVTIAVVLGAAIAFYPALDRARQEVLQQLEELNASYSWHLARLGSQLRMEEKQLARKLHKDVQGALVASALKLQADLVKGKSTLASIKKIRSQLLGALVELTEVEKPRPLKLFFKTLNQGWSPVFKISLTVEQALVERIEKDAVCLAAIQDLTGEFVTNAVKHGEATEGSVLITEVSQDILSIVFENNGKPFPADRTPGLGTRIALSQVISANFENTAQGVRFTTRLAIATK